MQPAKPQRTAAAFLTAHCSLPSPLVRKAAAALPQQQRHPMDAAPAFQLDGVSLAANFVARADPLNGKCL
ncbi:MAG: hypothetical protein GC192_23005 [Bacteroidetes bacterium]|nr:hypothetical protein [Bacteroidota bacterium]